MPAVAPSAAVLAVVGRVVLFHGFLLLALSLEQSSVPSIILRHLMQFHLPLILLHLKILDDIAQVLFLHLQPNLL